MTGYQESSSSNGHQDDMPYSNITLHTALATHWLKNNLQQTWSSQNIRQISPSRVSYGWSFSNILLKNHHFGTPHKYWIFANSFLFCWFLLFRSSSVCYARLTLSFNSFLYVLIFCSRNINMYLQFLSFLHTDMTEKVEILPHVTRVYYRYLKTGVFSDL